MCTYIIIFTTETDHPHLKSPQNGLLVIWKEDREEQDRAGDGWFHSFGMLKVDFGVDLPVVRETLGAAGASHSHQYHTTYTSEDCCSGSCGTGLPAQLLRFLPSSDQDMACHFW